MPATSRSIIIRFAPIILLVVIINVVTIHRKLARETPLLQDFTSPQSWSGNIGSKSIGNGNSNRSNNKNEIELKNNDEKDVADESFSACVLFMDDNHRLPEWLAFHYYALPLRHLIIAVDPASTQKFPNIPSRWKDLINITVWNDADFIPLHVNLTRNPADTPEDRRSKHRQRQYSFYPACSKHLKKYNPLTTWTSYHDTDEFLTISEDFFSKQNPRFSSSREVLEKATLSTIQNHTAFMTQPGYILKFLREYSREPRNTSPVHEDLSQVCIHVPRAKYSAVESPRKLTQRNVPIWINSDQFDTLRFRYRETKKFSRNGLAKGIIDLSRVTDEDINGGGMTHRPIISVCPKNTAMRQYGYLPLGIHHYLGSLESYVFRNDANHAKANWLDVGTNQDGGADDEIRPWIQGFFDSMGISLAYELLQGAGVLVKEV